MANEEGSKTHNLSILDDVQVSNDLFYALFQNSPVGNLLIDQDTRLIDANQFIFKFFNEDERPVKGKRFGNIFNCVAVVGTEVECGTTEECQSCLLRQGVTHVINSGESLSGVELEHHFNINGRADTKWFMVSATPVGHRDTTVTLVTFMDITERKHREEALVKIGITDELTGLYNRRYIMEQIEKQLALQLQTNQPLVVSMLDIDDFKRINDTFGHLVGDEILRALSSIIRSSIRYSDYSGRFGGEEFLIVLPNSTEDIGKTIIDRINQRLQAVSLTIIDKAVSFSAGLVEISPNQESPPDHFAVVDKADTLMYSAKTHGKNRVESGMF